MAHLSDACGRIGRIQPGSAERLPVKIYTTADGLGHNSVNRIVRDSRGFLWFCTLEGLSRFDGYSFTTYGSITVCRAR
jgi:streptogramin lyase